MLTPYQFASNRPIDGVDLDGLEYTRAAGEPRSKGMEARDNLAPFINVDRSIWDKPIVSIIGEDEIGHYSYRGAHPDAFIHNRNVEMFKRNGQALQNGGLVTAGYYFFNDPTLEELERVSAIESSILNLAGAKSSVTASQGTPQKTPFTPKVSGGSVKPKTLVKVAIPNQGTTKETYAPKPVKPEEAMMRIVKFLGPGPYTNLHPRTGEIDNNRVVSKDGLRSVRYGNHEINSSPTKHNYHEETWSHDKVNNCMNVDNIVVRVPLVTPKK